MAAQRRSITDLSDVVLTNAAKRDEKIRMGDLWSTKPALVVFLRRLGCPMCRVYAQDIEAMRPRLEKAGVNVVCISHEHFGEGSDEDRSWSAGGYFKGPIWVDEEKESYRTLLSRKTIWSGYGLLDYSGEKWSEVKERKVPGNWSGDGFQLGGTFIVDTDGSVFLDHRARFYGDDSDGSAIVSALTRCKGIKEEEKRELASVDFAAGKSESAADCKVDVCT